MLLIRSDGPYGGDDEETCGKLPRRLKLNHRPGSLWTIARRGGSTMSGTEGAAQEVFGLLERGRVERTRAVGRPGRRPAPRKAEEFAALLDDADGVLFLDIETTGLSLYYDEITLVGYQRAGDHGVFVEGDDPADLLHALADARVLVTFNGRRFDVPFLGKRFGSLTLPAAHVDLRYSCRRAGLVGGQKEIETTIGVSREGELEGVDGFSAVLLWHAYLRGDVEALRRLIDYNRADIDGMRAILDHLLGQREQGDLLLSGADFARRRIRPTGWAAEGAALPSPARLGRIQPTFTATFADRKASRARILGIDLTGSEKRPSGTCLLDGSQAETALVASDDELIALVEAHRPDLVSIDSPLSLPPGRISVFDDDPGRERYGIMRECERELKRRGINVYPCLLPSMQRLTQRGMMLAGRIRALGVPVIESYPGAAQDIMGIPRKGASEQWLKSGLADFGIEGHFVTDRVSHDELDAITAALVGTFFLDGRFEALGSPEEAPLIVPDLSAPKAAPVIGVSGRIAAGKTTAARALEELGFAYTRFSLVIDDEIRRRGEPLTRETRQRVGLEMHETKGQRWLCAKALERVSEGGPIVVDGLRWPEDAACLTERYGGAFLHLHVRADRGLRAARYARDEGGVEFDTANAQPVEAQIDTLGEQADVILGNDASIGAFVAEVRRVGEAALADKGGTCRSRSS